MLQIENNDLFKVIVAGGRGFDDPDFMEKKLDKILANQKNIQIVSGGQVSLDRKTGKKYGADYLGEEYAKKRGYGLKIFPADWGKHGKAAGPIRNREMGEYAEACIAFWDGKSRGTKSMIDIATELGLKLKIVMYYVGHK